MWWRVGRGRGGVFLRSGSLCRETPAHFNLTSLREQQLFSILSAEHHGLQKLQHGAEGGDGSADALVHHLHHRHRGVVHVSGHEGLGKVPRRAAGSDGEAGRRQGGVRQGQAGAGGEGGGGVEGAGPAEGRHPAAAGTPQRHQLHAGRVPAEKRESGSDAGRDSSETAAQTLALLSLG